MTPSSFIRISFDSRAACSVSALTVPSLRNAPDKHPVTVFQSTADVDYQLILVWIEEGARSD